MRSIPSDLLTKIQSAWQTIHGNADPKMDIIAQKVTKYLTEGTQLQARTIRTGNNNLGSLDICIRREDVNADPTEIVMVYIEDGLAKVATLPYVHRPDENFVYKYTMGPAVDVACDFDGRWHRITDHTGIYFDTTVLWALTTYGEPYIARVLSNGSLMIQQGQHGTSITLADSWVEKVSMLRAWKNVALYNHDQGLVVAYIRAGAVVYRNYCQQPDGVTLLWEGEREVGTLPAPAANVALFRTNDYRTGIVAEVAGQLYWVITTRNWANMALPPEIVECSISGYTVTLHPILHLIAGDGPYPTDNKKHHKAQGGLPAEIVAAGISLFDLTLLWAGETSPIQAENLPVTSTVQGEPVGTGNGAKVSFLLLHEPDEGILAIFLDGVLTTEYTKDGKAITFDVAPAVGVEITADYTWENWGVRVKVLFNKGISEPEGKQASFVVIDEGLNGYPAVSTQAGTTQPPQSNAFNGTRELVIDFVDFNGAAQYPCTAADLLMEYTAPGPKGEAGQDIGSFVFSFTALNLEPLNIPAPEVEAIWNE